jgi:hypothetical protein
MKKLPSLVSRLFSAETTRYLALAPALFGLVGCTRPTVGFCSIDDECEMGQYCAMPAHECTTATIIRGIFSGGQVIPPTASEATGSFMMVVSPDGMSGAYTLTHNVATATEISLVQGKVGSNGVAIKKLSLMKNDTVALDPDLVNAIKVGNYHILIASSLFPGGEVRAQLFSQDPKDSAGSVTLSGILTGKQESPPNGAMGAGQVQMTLDEINQTISYDFIANSLMGTVTGIHIHDGGFNINGPHICDLPATVNPTNTGALTQMDLLGCLSDPMRYRSEKHIWNVAIKSGCSYLNIHTDQFVKGELRAQLLPTQAVPFSVIVSNPAMTKAQANFYWNGDKSAPVLAYSMTGVPGFSTAQLCLDAGCTMPITCDNSATPMKKTLDKPQDYCFLQQAALPYLSGTGGAGMNLPLRLQVVSASAGILTADVVMPK